MRILMNPDPTQGGGGAAPAAAQATGATTTTPVQAAPPPAAPPAAPMVQLTPEQYQKLVENDRAMAQLRVEQEQKVRDAERKAAEAIGEKDGAKAALDKREEDYGRERSSNLQEIRETKAESALNSALAGFEAADDIALEQVKAILGPRIVVEKDSSGKWVALDAQTRRPATAVLREELAGAAFARFRKAPHAGGGGGGGGPRPEAPGGSGGAAPPTDLVTARRNHLAKSLIESGGGRMDGRSMGMPLGRPGSN